MAFRSSTRRTVAIAPEVTPGTAVSSFTSAHAKNRIFDVSFTPDVQKEEQEPFSPDLDASEEISGAKSGTIRVQTELLPSDDHATTDPPWVPYAEACGCVVKTLKKVAITVTSGVFVAGDTVTCNGQTAKVAQYLDDDGDLLIYDQSGAFAAGGITSNGGAVGVAAGDATVDGRVLHPSSDESDHKHSTVRHYNDGHLDIIAGALGTMSMTAEMGRSVKLVFELRGKLLDSAEAALLEEALTGLKPISFSKAGLTVKPGSSSVYTPSFETVELDLGNTVDLPMDANEPTGAGYSIAVIGRRTGSGRLDALATTKTEHDWRSHSENGDSGPLSFSVGETDGQRFEIHCPKVQYGQLSEGERAYRTTYDVPLKLAKNRGNDSFFILMR